MEAYCHCDSHENEPLMNRYNSLAAKELALLENLNELHLEVLINTLMKHPVQKYRNFSDDDPRERNARQTLRNRRREDAVDLPD